MFLINDCLECVWGQWNYSFTYFEQRQQIEVSGQLTAPAALFLEKDLPLPVEQRARWVPEPV